MVARKALVAGALGVVGRAMMHYLQKCPDWDVIGLSRRAPDFGTKTQFLQLDLIDLEASRGVLGELSEVTHLFYCAYAPRPTFKEEAEVNLAMLRNLMSGLNGVIDGLEHVQLVHGSKWYGCHLGSYSTPAREDDPRGPAPCFYFDQQDWLEHQQCGSAWTWSALRPHGICGFAVGSPISQLTILAAYGSIMAHFDRPLYFPGNPGAFSAVYQTTEASLLAEAMAWIATQRACANEAFNVTNGDFFRWEQLWPAVASFFGIEPGPARNLNLVEYMADKDPVWNEIRRKHQLKDYKLSDLANWEFANWLYNCNYDIMSSTTKLRKAGWNGFVDSVPMYQRLLGQLRDDRIIP